MLRLVRQFVMDADRGEVALAIAERPGSSGDVRWDALVAGVVEDLALRHGCRVPSWVRDPSLTLDTWWFVTDFKKLHPQAFVETPAALATHGVFMRRASLVNL